MPAVPAARATVPIEPTSVEHLLRWKVLGWGTQHWLGAAGPTQWELACDALDAAEHGTRDEFANSIGELARRFGAWNDAHHVSAALAGDPQALSDALTHNRDLQALHHTVVERADGRDVAEIATLNGLRLRAEHDGDGYETAIFVEDTPGRSDLLTRGTITAATVADALRASAEREHAAHGLDQTDLRLVEAQLARLHQLVPATPDPSDQALRMDPASSAPRAMVILGDGVLYNGADGIDRETLEREAPNLLSEFDHAANPSDVARATRNLAAWVDANFLANLGPFWVEDRPEWTRDRSDPALDATESFSAVARDQVRWDGRLIADAVEAGAAARRGKQLGPILGDWGDSRDRLAAKPPASLDVQRLTDALADADHALAARSTTPATGEAEWVDLGRSHHAPRAVLERYTPELWRQWQEHDGDWGVQETVAQRIWTTLGHLESARWRAEDDAPARSTTWSVEQFEQSARESARPLTTQDIAAVTTTGGPEFDFWRDVIGDDLVVNGVVYDSREWRLDGEGDVERIPVHERPGTQPIGKPFTTKYPRLAAEFAADASTGRRAGARDDPAQIGVSILDSGPEDRTLLEAASSSAGLDLQHDPAAATLADTLTRAQDAGWNAKTELPAVIGQAPLSVEHPALDLAYRVMDACPQATPPAPSVAQINGMEVASTDRHRPVAEQAIAPAPRPDHGPAVGR